MNDINKQSISIIIPAYNEEDRIADTIAGLADFAEISEIIVVDDCSSDATSARAAVPGGKVKVLRNERNLGKGGSMERGLRESTGGIVVFLDGDLGKCSAEGMKLAAAIREGSCDMAIADFYRGENHKGGFGIVLGAARRGLKRRTGKDFSSPISGQRAFRRETALALCPFPVGFGAEVGLTIRAHKKGFSIAEVPVYMTHKTTGKTLRGFIHRGKQLVHIIKTFASE